jgi:hypothetical protein
MSTSDAYEAIAHNVADVIKHGPRLTWNRRTAEIAIDRQEKFVLTTGLGSFGVGTMWCAYEDEKPEWTDLPTQSAVGGFGWYDRAEMRARIEEEDARRLRDTAP